MDTENNKEFIDTEEPVGFTYRDNYLEFKIMAGEKTRLFTCKISGFML